MEGPQRWELADHAPARRRDSLPPSILRPRLEARLEAAVRDGIALVTLLAPVGYGKSTLLRTWARRTQLRVRWVTPQRAGHEGGTTRRELVDDHSMGPDVIVADGVPDAVVQHLVASRPEHTTLVVAGRHLPPVSLARRRLLDEVEEIDAHALSFDDAELAALLDATDLVAGHELLERLAERTERWPAAVAMTVRRAIASGDLRAAIEQQRGDCDDLFELVRDEVIGVLDPPDADALVMASVLERCSGELLDAVTATGGGAATLQRLRDRQALVFREDERGRWYRVHPLLREAAQRALAQRADLDERELHRRAARWYAASGDHDGAVRHLLAARDETKAAHHLVRLVRSAEGDDIPSSAQRWFDALSHDARTSPEVSVALGWSYVQTRHAPQALSWVEQALVSVDDPVTRVDLLVLASFAHRVLFRHDDCVRRAEAALAGLPALASRPRRHALLQLMAGNQLAEVALWNGACDDADRHLADGFPLLERSGNRMAEVRMRGVQALVDLQRGDIHAARTNAELGQSFAEHFGLDRSHAAAEVRLALAMIAGERGHVGLAQETIRDALRLADPGRWPTTAVFIHAAIAHVAELDEAQAAVEELEAMERRFDERRLTARAAAARLTLAVRRGLVDEARRELARLDALPKLPDTARTALLASIALDDAPAVLAGSLALSGRTGVDEVLALSARAHHTARRNGPDAARAHVAEATRRGEERGLWTTVLHALGPTVVRWPSVLDAPVGTATASTGYLARLEQAAAAAATPRVRLVGRLSDRELALVSLLPTRLSNDEIARQLFISVNTVKTHLRHIYRKLDVANRDEAVLRLTQAGVIASAARSASSVGSS